MAVKSQIDESAQQIGIQNLPQPQLRREAYNMMRSLQQFPKPIHDGRESTAIAIDNSLAW